VIVSRIKQNCLAYSLFLSMFSEMCGARSSAGRLFRTQGPWTTKLRSPQFALVHGTVSRPACADRSWRLVNVDVGSQYVWRSCEAMSCWRCTQKLLSYT